MSALTSLMGINVFISTCVSAAASGIGQAIDSSKQVSAKTYVSYWYYEKQGQVYVSAQLGWVPTVFCRKRLTFRHLWGSFYNTAGAIKQNTRDYNDYASQAIKNQPSAHYNNTWITNQALYQYNAGQGLYVEQGW